MITVYSKCVKNVRNVYRKELGYVESLENRNETYIKRELGIVE